MSRLNQEKIMTYFSRKAALILYAAASFGGAIIGSAQAVGWSPSAPPVNQDSQPILPATTVPSVGDAPVQLAGRLHHYQDGAYVGPVVDAYYGLVQVRANVQGGRIVSVDVLKYPSDRRTSRSINAQALPVLESEVIGAQSAAVDTVSGATLTSRAYLRSINAALRQAGA
jgi:uncharacterized protein with FMN-binding domain